MTPAAGPALDDAGGVRDDRVRVENAAARLHHHEPASDAGPFDLGDHRTDVALDRRPDVGVDDGGRGALVLELLGEHVDREGDEGTGEHLPEDLAGPPFVGGVREGVEVADRDRLDPGGPGALRRRPHSRLVERMEHLAARPRPLPDLEAELARHERRRGARRGARRAPAPVPAGARARRGTRGW